MVFGYGKAHDTPSPKRTTLREQHWVAASMTGIGFGAYYTIYHRITINRNPKESCWELIILILRMSLQLKDIPLVTKAFCHEP